MKTGRTRRLVWASLAALLVVGLALAFVYGRPRPEIEVARVTRGTFERYVTEDGRTRARDRYVISAPIGGTLQRTHLHVGDEVSQGAVIAVLRPIPGALLDVRTRSELEQRVGAATAEVERARLTAERAEAARAHAVSELDIVKDLLEKKSVSTHERDKAQLDADIATKERDAARVAMHVAEHAADQARAALATASRTAAPTERFEMTAPVSGHVLRIYQESEGPIALGAPIVEVADSSDLEIVVDLLSTDAVNVDRGAEAKITGWGRPVELPARVRRVEPTAATKVSALGVEEQRVNVLLDPTESKDGWRRVGDGYRVDVHVLVERIDDALRLPTSALFRERGEWNVFVVKEGRLRSRVVKLRSYGPRESAVQEGVEESEEVVVQPSESLRAGDRVRTRTAG